MQPFLNKALELLASNEQLLAQRISAAVSTLYFNYHTLKGLAGSMGLRKLSESIHSAEQSISSMKARGASYDFDQLADEHQIVAGQVRRYSAIYTNILGKLGQGYSSWNLAELQEVFGYLSEDNSKRPLILKKFYLSCQSFAEELLSDAVAIATEIGKPEPTLYIEAVGSVDIFVAGHFKPLFAHLLRNALDHGIERAEHRSAQGKTEHGTLNLIIKSNDESHVSIIFSDDGAGLNLAKLRRKAQKLGLVDRATKLAAADIAGLIFKEDLSTADEITMISGRGIGLAAVKEKIETMGGQIQIQLLGQPVTDAQAFAFEIIIPLTARSGERESMIKAPA